MPNALVEALPAMSAEDQHCESQVLQICFGYDESGKEPSSSGKTWCSGHELLRCHMIQLVRMLRSIHIEVEDRAIPADANQQCWLLSRFAASEQFAEFSGQI